MKFRLDKILWIRDWLTLHSVEYVAVVHADRTDFVRLSGPGRLDVVLSVEAVESPQAAAAIFLDLLQTSLAWYGQPFAVLINNGVAFTYAKRLTGTDPTSLRKRLQLLSGDAHDFKWSFEHLGGEEYVIGQGIDRAFLASLQQYIEHNKLPVIGIGTLAAQLAAEIAARPSSVPQVYVQRWPNGSADWARIEGQGNFAFGQIGRSDGGDVTKILAELSCGNEIGNRTPVISASHAQPHTPLRKPGERRPRPEGTLRPTVTPYHTRPSNTARWLQRSLNVGRLLTAVLAATALASAMIALAFATGGADQDLDDIRRYQSLYSAKLELESRIKNLQRELAHADRSHPTETQSAPLVSLFCQDCVSGTYLTRLTVRHWGLDSTTVETKGLARRESQIFIYAAALNSFTAPKGFAVSAITPEVITSMGQSDTVQSFRLSLVLYGHSASK